jgi:hypothetical protein
MNDDTMNEARSDDLAYLPEILAAGLRSIGITPLDADRQAQALYRKELRDYEAAGSPYGPGHTSIIRWVQSQEPASVVMTV